MEASVALRSRQLLRVYALLFLVLAAGLAAFLSNDPALPFVPLLFACVSVACAAVVMLVFEVEAARTSVVSVIGVVVVALPVLAAIAWRCGLAGCVYTAGLGCVPLAVLFAVLSYAVTTQEVRALFCFLCVCVWMLMFVVHVRQIRGFKFVLKVMGALMGRPPTHHTGK